MGKAYHGPIVPNGKTLDWSIDQIGEIEKLIKLSTKEGRQMVLRAMAKTAGPIPVTINGRDFEGVWKTDGQMFPEACGAEDYESGVIFEFFSAFAEMWFLKMKKITDYSNSQELVMQQNLDFRNKHF
jgi:hypothetical protein